MPKSMLVSVVVLKVELVVTTVVAAIVVVVIVETEVTELAELEMKLVLEVTFVTTVTLEVVVLTVVVLVFNWLHPFVEDHVHPGLVSISATSWNSVSSHAIHLFCSLLHPHSHVSAWLRLP